MSSIKRELQTVHVIKTRLKELNMTAAQLSRLSGVPHSTLSQWLSNAIPKSPAQAQAVADVLKVSLHHFYWGEDEALPQRIEEMPHNLQEVLSGFYHIQISKVISKK